MDLPGYRVFSMSGSTRPRTPGSTGAARHCAAPVVAYRRDKTVGTHQPKLSGLHTFKVGFTRYLCTSPAFVPTHRPVRYRTRRKARYWARGSRLPRRDSHPLEHAALPGRTVPDILFCFSLNLVLKRALTPSFSLSVYLPKNPSRSLDSLMVRFPVSFLEPND